VPGSVGRSRAGELPAPGLVCDRSLRTIPGGESGCGKEPAIVGAAGQGTIRIDRAPLVDQHRTAPILFVAHDDVSSGLAGSREEEFVRYRCQDPGFPGSDVDELRGATAGDTLPAGNLHIRPCLQGVADVMQPGAERTGGKGWGHGRVIRHESIFTAIMAAASTIVIVPLVAQR